MDTLMERELNNAAKAWGGATLNVQRFADAYVTAIAFREDEGRERFALAYPMFGPREWKRLELIGTMRLLPQFMFKSDAFVAKILRIDHSMRWQKALVSASDNGLIRIDRGHGPEKVKLSELTKQEEKTLTFLLSESDANLKPTLLLTKFKTMVSKVNKQNASKGRPTWEIRESHGHVYAYFSRACSMDRSDLSEVMKALNQKSVGKTGKSSSVLLKKLVSAIVRLEALRDDEWTFEEDHGPHRDCWSEEDEREHDELLGDIQQARNQVRDLARAATGDAELEV